MAIMSLLLSLGIYPPPPPKLHLSNIEEVLVYFWVLLDVTHALMRLVCAAASLAKQLSENRFGLSIFLWHHCLVRSIKPKSLIMHIIMIKLPGGDDNPTWIPQYCVFVIYIFFIYLCLFEIICPSHPFVIAKKCYL